MKLAENFNQQDFDTWVEGFLPDFDRNVRKVDVPASFTNVKSINTLGESPIGVRVYVIETDADPSKRKVGLATDSFTLLKNYGSPNAIIAYYSENASLWRISLLTSTPIWSEGRIITKLSNPKRQSYVLGSKAKVKTPHQYLISKGKVLDFNDLKSRFSLEVVNKEFYREISQAFTQLVGGTVANGKSKKSYEALLKLPFLKDHSQTNLEFAVRLIGRIIFCWFLREKRSASGHSLMPKELVSFDASQTIEDYYHKILEPIFFEILNKPIKTRKDTYINELFLAIPYLNGGLFSPHEDDFFSYNEGKQAINHNMVVIPDEWFKSLFEVLETYNFTIDENTSFDEELSIDPEMLGRIFENLLAEINPETGESARKSTGSYYTPRVIVEYMVDQSLFMYLKDKTMIKDEIIQSLISYDLEDDFKNPIRDNEKILIVEALSNVKLLDPACGSGAFPIGALQKIVYMLQQIDPNAKQMYETDVKNISPEYRRFIQKEYERGSFDYIRKLRIIRECIYGIDIQPIATEISRLRCFLTLIVDQRIDDTEDNRGIQPLPNLDFKFVTANSLIGLPKIENNQLLMFDEKQNIDDLKNLMSQFFNADELDKFRLINEFHTIQKKIIKQYFSEKDYSNFEKKKMLTDLGDWEPFGHQKSSWFDPEWMFGIKDGFDIVISNPPYLGEKGHKDIFRELRSGTLSKYYLRKMDLFYFFFHLSLNLGKINSITAFITTNYYPTATGAKNLRKDFNIRSTIIKLINFNELKIFESAKGQHNLITIIRNKKDSSYFASTAITQRRGSATPDILQDILNEIDSKTKYFKVSQDYLYDGPEMYIRLEGKNVGAEDPEQKILSKIDTEMYLDQFCYINMGVQSGADKVGNRLLNKAIELNYINKEYLTRNNINVGSPIYIVSHEFINNLPENESHVIKKYIKNSDIKRYFIDNKKDEYYLYLDSQEDIEKLPYIKKHLSVFRPILKAREQVNDNNDSWYWIRGSKRKYLINTGMHIVCPYRAKKNIFALTDGNTVGAGDVYFITQKDKNLSLKYILALLNSKLYFFWLYHRGKRKGEVLELYQKPLSELPIKIISLDEQNTYIEIVDMILSLTNSIDYIKDPKKQSMVKQHEMQIDQLVYKLYELTDDEIKIIETLFI